MTGMGGHEGLVGRPSPPTLSLGERGPEREKGLAECADRGLGPASSAGHRGMAGGASGYGERGIAWDWELAELGGDLFDEAVHLLGSLEGV